MEDWLFQDQPFPNTPSQTAPVKSIPRTRGPSQSSYETCQHLYGPSQIHLYDTVEDLSKCSLAMDDNDANNVLASLVGDYSLPTLRVPLSSYLYPNPTIALLTPPCDCIVCNPYPYL